jgi:hypothetical protein
VLERFGGRIGLEALSKLWERWGLRLVGSVGDTGEARVGSPSVMDGLFKGVALDDGPSFRAPPDPRS